MILHKASNLKQYCSEFRWNIFFYKARFLTVDWNLRTYKWTGYFLWLGIPTRFPFASPSSSTMQLLLNIVLFRVFVRVTLAFSFVSPLLTTLAHNARFRWMSFPVSWFLVMKVECFFGWMHNSNLFKTCKNSEYINEFFLCAVRIQRTSSIRSFLNQPG